MTDEESRYGVNFHGWSCWFTWLHTFFSAEVEGYSSPKSWAGLDSGVPGAYDDGDND